jgi:hypothetical protein
VSRYSVFTDRRIRLLASIPYIAHAGSTHTTTFPPNLRGHPHFLLPSIAHTHLLKSCRTTSPPYSHLVTRIPYTMSTWSTTSILQQEPRTRRPHCHVLYRGMTTSENELWCGAESMVTYMAVTCHRTAEDNPAPFRYPLCYSRLRPTLQRYRISWCTQRIM